MWMAIAWGLSLIATAAAVLVVIRHRYGPRYIAKRVATPLAVIERSLLDAMSELGEVVERSASLSSKSSVAFASQTPRNEMDCFVNAFEPVCKRLSQIPNGEIASLGASAYAAHSRLLVAMQQWNARAGHSENARALLPTVVMAHLAARELSRHILPEELEDARDAAHHRILFSLVAPDCPTTTYLQ